MRRRSSSDTYSDIERKKEKRRIAWMIEQKKEQEHERLKRKKIEEYERKRAEQLGISKQRSSRRSRSRSDDSNYRSHLKSKTMKSQIMSEKRNLADGNKSFFKGPEQPQKIHISELQQVTVKIHRKIPASATETNEIRRFIINPEEITLKRREGEGTKPIFDRDELKNSEKIVEVEEHRTVEAVGKSSAVKRSHVKRRSVSLSPKRRHSPSPSSRSGARAHSRHSRSSEYLRYRSEEHRDKDYKAEIYYSDTRECRDTLRRSKKSEDRSYSRERDYHKSKHDYSRSEKDRREYSDRFKELSYDRRERRERESREHLPSTSQYLEQVPYPLYYGGFAPRPMLIRPAVPPIRGPLIRGRVPTPIRQPCPPRFIGPQSMYRVVLPHDPRYGQMY